MYASREATYRYEFVVKSERCVVLDGLMLFSMQRSTTDSEIWCKNSHQSPITN